ncbi:MAG: PAS domain S-box protein [Deltaproteobacteria bacterium]|nr:PAS domain S-box protein [Deltaproteobacteria bacterium]
MSSEPPHPIVVGGTDTRERKKRQRETWLALAGSAVIGILSWVELKFLGVDSYLFLALFNINLILLLLVLFLVLRNVVKLVLERRRKVLGARLRTRLVLIFLFLSILPTTLMFLIALQFVQTSVDYWFKNQVDKTMEQALVVGQSFFQDARQRLGVQAGAVRDELSRVKSDDAGLVLAAKAREHGLSMVGLMDGERNEIEWYAAPEWSESWTNIKTAFSREDRDLATFWSMVWPGDAMDFVVGILPLDRKGQGYIVLGDTIGGGLMHRLEQIEQGINEYRQLKTLMTPLKLTLYLILGVMTLLILLGATWFGFRLAKEISAPVQALAAGTQRIARGDLGVRLEDKSTDELGVLVQSFNRMAEDLESGQRSLTEANTRLARQNAELERREDYMRAVLNNIAAGVISVDERGMVGTVNRAAEVMLGIDANVVVGRSPLEIVPEIGTDLIRDVLNHLNTNPSHQWQRQLELSVSGKTIKILVNAVVLRTGDGRRNGIVAVFEDITELEKMQRLNAWKEVARRIAHEIKNPLTPIKLSAQRLERKFGPLIEDPAFAECTSLIIRQAEHLRAMVTEFSSFARIPEILPRPNDLLPLAREILSVFQHSHRHITWELSCSRDALIFAFDLEAMRRALMNLLLNAAEILESREDGAVHIDLGMDPERKSAVITIQDNGPGLTKEERSRMFEPYYSRKRGGTGLGLTIVKSVIDDHRGNIRVKAHPKKGTCFEIFLPLGRFDESSTGQA